MPLILLIFGLGDASKVALVAMGVFYLVLINTAAGVMTIEPVYLEVGRNFVGLVVIAVLGWLTTLALDAVERMLIPWKPGR